MGCKKCNGPCKCIRTTDPGLFDHAPGIDKTARFPIRHWKDGEELGNYYLSFSDIALKVNNTAIGYVPTSSGNTSDLNSVIIDSGGDKWIIDILGNATKLGGGSGSVTSVAATISGALSVSGSPITSSGTLAFSWTGAVGQYVRGDGSLATFPTLTSGTVTSISAGAGMDFVTITASGSIIMGLPSNITLASTNSVSGTTHSHAFVPGGTTAQYIRGDGSLATLPTDLDAQTLSWTKATSNLAISGGNNVNLFTLTSLATNDLIKWDGLDWVNFAPTWTTNVGTVTSVGMTITGSTALTVAGSPITTSGTFAVTWTGTSAQYVKGDGTLGTYSGGSGTVTSVGLALPSSTFDITGSPVTTTGTLTGGFISQTKKTVLAAPWGSNGTPLWRQLQISDLQQNGATDGQVVTWNSGAGEWTATTPSGTGTVTSVSAGNGMTFTTITTSGSVTMGTPSNISLASINSVAAGTHSHKLALGGTSAQYLRGDNTLATFPTIPTINWADERIAFGQTSASGLNYSANFIYHITPAAITLGTRTAGTIGGYSLALGLNNKATANYCYAFGSNNSVGGGVSVAVGDSNSISAQYSFAAGASNTITGAGNAVALGNSNSSSGSVGVSIGYQCTASGLISTAIGDLAIASANWAKAFGRSVTASHEGAMVLGDGGTTVQTSSGTNTLTGRFAGGYFYYGGAVLIDNLSGTGTRMVVASSTGALSTQAIPSGGSSVWKIQGGSVDATAITDNIYHNGNVALGNFAGGTSAYRLSVAGTSYFTGTMITNNNTAFQAFNTSAAPVEVWKLDSSNNWLFAASHIKVTSTDIVIDQYPNTRTDDFLTVPAARLLYTDSNGKILLTDKKAFYNDHVSAGSKTQQTQSADSTWRRLTNDNTYGSISYSSQFAINATYNNCQIPRGNGQRFWLVTTIEYEMLSGTSGQPDIEVQIRINNSTTNVMFSDWRESTTGFRKVITIQSILTAASGSGLYDVDIYFKVITGTGSVYVNKHETVITNIGYIPS